MIGEESRQLRKVLHFEKNGNNREYPLAISEAELREMSLTCFGDLRLEMFWKRLTLFRHAISALQIRMLSSLRLPRSFPDPVKTTERESFDLKGRDKSFSMLHGLGKLLHSTLSR